MRTKLASASLVVAAAAVLLAATPASGKDGDVLVRGSCTGVSTSKLKLSNEDGRIEVEFEVDQNRNGVRWIVRLSHNGRRIARLSPVTRPPSGSFETRILARNAAGADVFAARATRPSEVCSARARFS
jgi:hypothetical protein